MLVSRHKNDCIHWSLGWSEMSAGYNKDTQKTSRNALSLFESAQTQLMQQINQPNSSVRSVRRPRKYEISTRLVLFNL